VGKGMIINDIKIKDIRINNKAFFMRCPLSLFKLLHL